VLYRLHQHDHIAYLVGGSVRDLILGRKPKDFDIGTDAHPYEIKRLFRNCWIIGGGSGSPTSSSARRRSRSRRSART
jgi:tRNA nucleotidyltransferase/poly(A) polymerase